MTQVDIMHNECLLSNLAHILVKLMGLCYHYFYLLDNTVFILSDYTCVLQTNLFTAISTNIEKWFKETIIIY